MGCHGEGNGRYTRVIAMMTAKAANNTVLGERGHIEETLTNKAEANSVSCCAEANSQNSH